MNKCKGILLAATAGVTVGAALSCAVTAANTPPLERALHKKLRCVRGGIAKWMQLLGV